MIVGLIQVLELGVHWRHTALLCCLLEQLAIALSLLGEHRALKQVGNHTVLRNSRNLYQGGSGCMMGWCTSCTAAQGAS